MILFAGVGRGVTLDVSGAVRPNPGMTVLQRAAGDIRATVIPGTEGQVASASATTPGAAAVAVAPIPSVPARTQVPTGSLVTPVRAAGSYFRPEMRASSDIQRDIFDTWQTHHQTLSEGYLNEVTRSVLDCVHEIQRRDVARIHEQEQSSMKTKVANAEVVEERAHKVTEFYKAERDEFREENEDKDMQFMAAFGVRMKDWDGTAAHARTLLNHEEARVMSRKLGLVKPAKLIVTDMGPKGPPPPPPPPPAGGASATQV